MPHTGRCAPGDDRAEHARLVRTILTAGRVTFTGPPTYTTAEPISWTMQGFGEQLAEIRAACGAG